jgi:2-polyprenyl-3-methyl-5-hydroxy-6-metoxy-1,4-benzoquinol methylase
VALGDTRARMTVVRAEPKSRCPACQATTGDGARPTPLEGFTVRRCRRCRLRFTVPQLSPHAMRAFYDARYYGSGNIRFGAVVEWVVRWCRRRRADTMCRVIPRGRALDIGCGRGLILNALRARGWTVAGVELHEAAARHAREVLGLDVTVGPYRADRFPPEAFDAVILWHVLEHLADPVGVVRGLARLLRPGGLVAIAVPNIESWQARLTRGHWVHLDLPRHYSHFSEAWLRTVLDAAGFRVIAVSHFALEYNLFGWIQSLLNCWGLPHNLLYDLLKRRSARTIRRPWRTYPVQSLVSAAALGLLLVPVGLLSAVEALCHRGATIELLARKERLA